MLKGGHYVVSEPSFPDIVLPNEEPDLVPGIRPNWIVTIFAQQSSRCLTSPGATWDGTVFANHPGLQRCHEEDLDTMRGRGSRNRAEGAGRDADGKPNYISATKIRKAIRGK